MKRWMIAPLLGAGALVLLAGRASAQSEWAPPTRQMPQMPRTADLGGAWRSAAGAWGASAQQLSGVALGSMRASGDPAPRSDQAVFVRFTGDARPVANWSDRNGDGRADMVELFRDGTTAVQVIDADYDGTADAVRHFDASGNPTRTETL